MATWVIVVVKRLGTIVEVQLPERYALDPAHPVLGEGGMGRVLLARDELLGVPVALKVVRPDLAADRRFRKLFDLEVRVSARFTHDNIVPLHDLGELGDGTPFLGLAFADAGSFANLRTDPPRWSEMLRLLLEFIDALAHLHTRGVLHRDLKPENVLLHTGQDGQRHVWLADLGLANATSNLARRKGRVEGTPGFMAPEQRLGLPREYGPWTDLYSLGVILWDLVTGALPFPPGRSPLDADLEPLVPRAGLAIPTGLELVLANLLAAEPLSRYDLAADLRTELLALGQPTVESTDLPKQLTGRAIIGTVAPSAPSLTSATDENAEGLPPSLPATGSSTFYDLDEIEDPAELNLGVPVWNRPIPRRFPRRPPLEPGFGATARASLQLFAVREVPLVARDNYRIQLWNQAREVLRRGRSRVVLVVGEAGSGKTRLVDSIRWALEEGGWAETVALSYQSPPGKEDGYPGAARALVRPWNETRQSLEIRLRRRLARERGAMDRVTEETSSSLARWAGLVLEGEEPPPLGLGLREVYRHLEARTWRGLALLVLDNVQWSVEDGDGLTIAEAVLRRQADGERERLLVVATLRSEDLARDAALADQVDALVEAGAQLIELPRLSRWGTGEVLRQSLTLTPALEARVAERCEGNPLFARQLLIEWVSRGWLVDTGGLQFGLAPGVDPDAVLPADAQVLFLNRVDAMASASGQPDAFRDLIHMVALVGQQIPRLLFETLAGTDLYAFARGCGVWTEREDHVQFDHGLLLQAVRGQAEAREDAAILHRRLARAWTRYGLSAGVPVHLEVGRHAVAAREWEQALGELLAASRLAHEAGRAEELHEASALAVQSTLALGDSGAAGGWAYTWRGLAWRGRGDAHQALEAFRAAQDRFQRSPDPEGMVTALVGCGWASRQAGALQQSEERYATAMQLSRQAGDRRLEAQAITGMAWLELLKRNYEGADILFTRVENRFSQIEDEHGVAEATMGHAIVARRMGEFGDADELYREASSEFAEIGDHLGVARAAHGRAQVQRQRRDLDGAAELYREAMAAAEEIGAVGLAVECRQGLAEVARAGGDRERSRKLLGEVVRWAERKESFDTAILGHLTLAMLAHDEGDARAMHGHAGDASRYLERVPAHWLWAPYRLVVAVLLARRGDGDQTWRWLWSATELGLGDFVDQDIADLLVYMVEQSVRRRWAHPLQVAGKLAVRMLTRLGRAEDAAAIRQQLS